MRRKNPHEGRQLQERQDIGDGWFTEWEPCMEQPALDTDKEWRACVAALNRAAKLENSRLRFRSVEVEE